MVADALERPANLVLGASLHAEAVSHAFDIRGAPLSVLDRVSLTVAPGGFWLCWAPRDAASPRC